VISDVCKDITVKLDLETLKYCFEVKLESLLCCKNRTSNTSARLLTVNIQSRRIVAAWSSRSGCSRIVFHQ
jgi:hypothetical protein